MSTSIDDLLMTAHALVESARLDVGALVKACHLYGEALARQPNLAVASLGRARAFVKRRRWSEALDDCRHAAEQGLDSADLHLARGQAHAGLGDRRSAVEEFRAAIDRDGRMAAAHLGWAKACLADKAYDEALGHLVSAIAAGASGEELSDPVRDVLNRGGAAAPPEVVTALRTATRSGRHPSVHAVIGVALLKAQHEAAGSEGMVLALETAVQLGQRMPFERVGLSALATMIVASLGSDELRNRVRAAFEDAAPADHARWGVALASMGAVFEDTAPADHARWGVALAAAGAVAEALDWLQRAVRGAPSDREVHAALISLGSEIFMPDTHRDALVRQLAARMRSVDVPSTLVEWSLMLADLGRFREALEAAQRAPNLAGPPVPLARLHRALGVALKGLGRWDEAAGELLFAVEQDDRDSWACLEEILAPASPAIWRGRLVTMARGADITRAVHAAVLLGKIDAAGRALVDEVTAKTLGSSTASAALDWGRHLAEVDRPDEALACLRRAVTLDPELAAAHLRIGELLRLRGEVPAAIEACRTALAVDPRDREAYSVWTRALADDGLCPALARTFQGYEPAIALRADWAALETRRALVVQRARELSDAVERDCDDDVWDVYAECAQAFTREGVLAEAEQLLAAAVRRAPLENWLLHEWGVSRWRTGDFAGARDTFAQLIERPDEAFRGHLSRARAHRALGGGEAACGDLDIALRHAANDAQRGDVYFEWAITLRDLRDYDGALGKLAQALRLNPDAYWLHFQRGYMLTDRGLYDEAVDAYRVATNIDRTQPHAHHNVAYVWEMEGRYRLAREHWAATSRVYQRGLSAALARGDSDWCVNYGNLRAHLMQDFDGAEALLRAALLLRPGDTGALEVLANIHLERRKRQAAPRGLEGWTPESAVADLRARDYWRAWQSFDRAKRLLGARLERSRAAGIPDPQTLMELGEFHLLFEEAGAAEPLFREAVERDPASTRARKGLGESYLRTGRADQAVRSFRVAREMAPQDLAVRSRLGEAYFKVGNLEDAEGEYLQVLAIARFHMDSLLGLGEVYVDMAEKRAGDRDAAGRADFYVRAVEYLSRALDVADSGDRPLSVTASPASAYYLRGYVQVKRVEAYPLRGRGLLRSAARDFEQCQKLEPNHVKAARAAQRIQESARRESLVERWGASAVLGLGLLLFLFAHYALLVGVPASRDVIVLTADAMTNLKSIGVAADVLDRLRLIEAVRFPSDELMVSRLKEVLGDDKLKDRIVRAAEREAVWVRASMPVGYYVLMAFGSVLVVVAGAFLPQLTSLKLAGLQLDKTATERTETLRSIGISR